MATIPSRKRLFSNALTAIISTVASAALLFVLYRYLLGRMGAELLGVWSLVVASTNAARLSDLGLAAGSTKFVASYLAKSDAPNAAHIVETSLLSLLVASALVVIVAYPALGLVLSKFVPADFLQPAIGVLPWVLAAFTIGLIAGAPLSGLDGCQRTDLRVSVTLAGQFVLLASALVLVPRYGLQGIAAAQVIQSVLVLVGSWFCLRTQLTTLPAIPHRWNRASFRKMLSYSAAFQLNGVLVVLVDPLVKLLLARYGGLAATAYFDMANQLVQRIRQLLVSATQVLIPVAAHAHEFGPDQVRDLYLKSYRTVFAVTVPFFCVTAVLVPAISVAWIGHQEPSFATMAWIALAGLSLNAIGTPAYFSNLGTGHIRPNIAGHGLITLLTSTLGWAGGHYFGAVGVTAGYMIAMAIGALYTQTEFQQRHRLPPASLVPAESLSIAGLSGIGVVVCLTLDSRTLSALGYFQQPALLPQMARMLLLASAFAAITAFGIWPHPVRRALTARLGTFTP